VANLLLLLLLHRLCVKSCGAVVYVISSQHQLPVEPLWVCTDSITPVQCYFGLGSQVESAWSIRFNKRFQLYRCTTRQLRSIRRSVSKSVSLVLTRLEYGSATLTGIPKSWHSVEQAPVFIKRRYAHDSFIVQEHMTPLRSLLRDSTLVVSSGVFRIWQRLINTGTFKTIY